jgi:hypothetical protein
MAHRRPTAEKSSPRNGYGAWGESGPDAPRPLDKKKQLRINIIQKNLKTFIHGENQNER